MLTAMVQMPANTYTYGHSSAYVGAPNLYYFRNTEGIPQAGVEPNSLNGVLSMYYNFIFWGSLTPRYRIAMRGGSGNGNRDECERFAGPLPAGYYGRGTDDATRVLFYRKEDRDRTIRGWVWYLGDKPCEDGTIRDELFIHSQGYSGWHDDNYVSDGCIKINQVDRGFMASQYRIAYSHGDGRLKVHA